MALGGALAGVAKVVLGVEDAQFKRDLSQDQARFHRAANDMQRDTEKVARGALAGSGAMHSLGRSVAFASSAFLGGAGFTYVVRSSISAASDLNEQINKSKVVFREGAKEVEEFGKTSARSFGIAEHEAIGMAATFGNMLVPMGFARTKAADMSVQLVKLAADMASFNNADPSEVLQALQSGLAGQVRPLRQYGVFLDQARIKAEAFSSGIAKADVDMGKVRVSQERLAIAQVKYNEAISKYGEGTVQAARAHVILQTAQNGLNKALAGSTSQLTAAQKAAATYAIILKDSKDAQGDFARTSGGLANQQRILKAEVTDLEAKIGTALLPTVLSITKGMTAWLSSTKNQETVQRDVTEVVDTARSVLGGFATVVRTADKVTGGLKQTLELLLALAVVSKISAYANSFKLLAAQEGVAATQGGLLLRNLRGLRGMSAIAIAIDVGMNFLPQGKGKSSALGRIPIFGDAYGFGLWIGQQIRGGVEDGLTGPMEGKGHGPGGRPETAAEANRGAQASTQQGLVSTARKALGVPYRYGGAPSISKPTDCSGLMVAVFAENGLRLPRTSQEQYAQAPIKNQRPLLVGDLVFAHGVHPGHVGLYIGGGQVLEDPHTGDHVKIVSLKGFGWNGESARWWGGTKKGAAGGGGTTAPVGTSDTGDTTAGTGKPLKEGTAAQKDTDIIPKSLQLRLSKADLTKGYADDLAALRAIEKYLEERIKHEKDINKRIELLQQLKQTRDDIQAINEKAADAAKKRAEARTKKAIAAIDAVSEGIKRKIAELEEGGTETQDKPGGGKEFKGTSTVRFDPKTGKYIVVKIKPDVDGLRAELSYILDEVLPQIDREIARLKAAIKRLEKHPRKNKTQLAQMRAKLKALQNERKEIVALAKDLAVSIDELQDAISDGPEPEEGVVDRLGGKPNIPDEPGAEGEGVSGGDVGSSAPSGPSPEEIQAQINAQTVGYLTSVRELRSFQPNIANPAIARLLNPLGTLGGSTITVNVYGQQFSTDPFSWSKQIQSELQALVG